MIKKSSHMIFEKQAIPLKANNTIDDDNDDNGDGDSDDFDDDDDSGHGDDDDVG